MWRFFLAYLISCGVMLAISSLCFMISTFSRNSVTPIIITISAVFIGSAISFIPLEIFELVNPYLFTGYIDLFLAAFHDPVPWGLIKNATVICGLWSSVFIVISFYNFSNKEILSISTQGWVRNKRTGKNISFINLNDGSVLSSIQIILEHNKNTEEEIKMN